MKTIPHLGKILILFAFTILVYSCSKNDDDANPQTDDEIGNTDDEVGGTDDDPNAPNSIPNIIELAESVNMLSTLLGALDVADAGLVDALSADGQLTVFAPTNDAFNDLLGQLDGFESLDDFNEAEEKALLAEILKYHVVSGTAAFSPNLSDGQILETLQTENLTVKVDASIFIEDKTDELAEVVSADNEASNGVVHIVNKILLPQAALNAFFPKPSIVELVTETEGLSLLEEAVLKAGLNDNLNADGPFTLFAPTNEAIEELFDLLGDSFNSFDDFDNFLELQILEQILLYHVVPNNIGSTELTPGTLNTLLANETIEIISSGETFVIGDASNVNANFTETDKDASNGVVHIIDKILIPQQVQDFLNTLNPGNPSGGIPTIKELVEESDEFTFLKEALEITGLLDTLGEDGPYTVFAPSNNTISMLFGLLGNSFSKIEDFDLDSEINLLKKVLSYHIVPGIVTSNDLAIGNVNTLHADDALEVGYENGSFFLRDALGFNVDLLVTDIPAGNGIIHTVDRVLIPQSVIDILISETESTLMEILERIDPEHKELAIAAVMMARDSFKDIIDNEFTFFLPTNEAFLELFDQLDGINSLADFNTEEEIRLLGKILAYHFIDGTKALSSDLYNNQELITFQGEKLNIIVNSNVYVLDKTGEPSKVTSSDTEILEGVIHIIDKVLLPQGVLSNI